jgi:hypothetical protein
MTQRAFLVHRHVSRSGPRHAKGNAHPLSSPGAPGARRETVKVANLIASHYGFAISGTPPGHADSAHAAPVGHQAGRTDLIRFALAGTPGGCKH